MTFNLEIDFAVAIEWRNWLCEFAPFNRWRIARTENCFGNPTWSFGPFNVTWLRDSADL